MPSFQVYVEDLHTHAQHLDELRARMDTAIDAAHVASMSDGAYGLLCSFLPGIVNPMEDQGISALHAAREAIDNTSQNVRKTANDYRDVDHGHAEELGKFRDAVQVRPRAVALRGVPPVGDVKN